MTFGEKLQTLRKANGMSQEQLASQITVSRQAVSKWELDESNHDVENVIQLSGIFGVSIDYLLKESESNDAVQQHRSFAQNRIASFGMKATVPFGMKRLNLAILIFMPVSMLSSLLSRNPVAAYPNDIRAVVLFGVIYAIVLGIGFFILWKREKKVNNMNDKTTTAICYGGFIGLNFG